MARRLKNEAKPPWVAGTPTLPFESVFPGITNDIDKDVIEKENLHRKYRQSRWLQSPLATEIEDCMDDANICGKDADATRQTKLKPRKSHTISLSPVVPKIEHSIDETKKYGKDADKKRQTKVKPVNEQTSRRQNPRKGLNTSRKKMTAMHRRAKRLTAASSSKIDGWIDEANNNGKDADASAMRETKGTSRKWQNSQKLPAMHRRAKRAAQQDSVTRLSRVKEPVPQPIYYPQSKPSRTSATSLRSTTMTRKLHRNSLSMVCGVYTCICIYCTLTISGGGKFDGEMRRGFR